MMGFSSIYTFNNSQEFVVKKLNKIAEEASLTFDDEDTDYYILAMARKGPRSLETMWKKEYGGISLESSSNRYKMLNNIITEIALPFLFNKLNKEGKKIHLCVYDDAIYYGTTFMGVNEVLDLYKFIYPNTTISKIFLTGIKSHDAKRDIENLISDKFLYYGMPDSLKKGDTTSDGFSHFFVKKLTSNIRSLQTAFEVEFPVVSFEHTKKDVECSKEHLFELLKNKFGNNNVYYIQNEENESFTIVFGGNNESQFVKLRIFIASDGLRIASFSPRILPNDIFALERLFPNGDYGRLWQDIVTSSAFPDNVNVDNFHAYRKLERHLCKTLVVLANYLLSYSFFVSLKNSLEDVFLQLGYEVKPNKVSEKDLCYLIGDINLVKKVQKQLNDFYENNIVCETLNYNTTFPPVDKIIFEGNDFPLPKETIIFEEQNDRMLANSESSYESLSALFFNMKSLIEKWIIQNHEYDRSRLRFGYTFEAIIYQIYRHHEKFVLSENLFLDVHRWIDKRIDQGSVVPQYIVNPVNNRWYRIFRPGENEDALLSHLARYVLFVYKCIDDIEKLGWIGKSFFENILCLSVLDPNLQNLNKELGIELIVSEEPTTRTLLFRDNDDASQRSVLDYMFRMIIFDNKEDKVSMSPRLYDRELTQFTTLDRKVVTEISNRLTKIIKEADKHDKTHILSYETINRYYYEAQCWNYNDEILNQALINGEIIIEKIRNNNIESDGITIIAGSYLSLLKYIISSDKWDSYDIQLKDRDRKLQERFTAIKFVYDIIVVLFFSKNLDSLQYILNEFHNKINNKNVFLLNFRKLYNYCNEYKGKSKSIDNEREEICELLKESINILKQDEDLFEKDIA